MPKPSWWIFFFRQNSGIKAKIVLLTTSFIVIFLFSFSALVYLSNTRSDLIFSTEVATRNRSYLLQLGYLSEQYAQQLVPFQELEQVISSYDYSLAILENGGVHKNISYARKLSSASSPIREKLTTERQSWENFKEQLYVIFQDNISYQEKQQLLPLVRVKAQALSNSNEDVITTYRTLHNTIEKRIFFFIGFVFITWPILIGGFAYLLLYVLRQINKLIKAAEDIRNNNFENKLQIVGNDEFTELSKMLNLVMVGMQKALENVKENLSEKTSALNTTLSEMAEKNKSLEESKLAMLKLLEDLAVEKKKDEILLNSIGEGMVVTDSQGNIQLVNPVFTTLLGWTAEEVVGKPLVSILRIFDKNRNEIADQDRPFAKAVKERKSLSQSDVYYKAKNGELLPVVITIAPLLDSEENSGAIELFRDVSVEKEYLDQIERFKLAVEEATDLIVMTDPEGNVIYANKALVQTTGFTQEEALGTKAGKLWGNQMGAEYYANLWTTIKEKQPFIGQIKNKRKDGSEYFAEVKISPVLDDSNQVLFFVAIERDVTKEKLIDLAKTEFVSLASHQLRTPLTAINWYTEMLLDGTLGEMQPPQIDHLKEIKQASKKMVELVNSLLNVSRIEMGTFAVSPKPTDLLLMLDNVLVELEPIISKKKIKITKQADPIELVSVDPNLTRIVYQNLLSNAVKYSQDGGEVLVSHALETIEGSEYIHITIVDHGLGIPKNQQDKVFTKLFRAVNIQKLDTEGTGLGLYIVKSIIDQTKGKIWFESQEGKGSTFHVLLPKKGMEQKEGTKQLEFSNEPTQ